MPTVFCQLSIWSKGGMMPAQSTGLACWTHWARCTLAEACCCAAAGGAHLHRGGACGITVHAHIGAKTRADVNGCSQVTGIDLVQAQIRIAGGASLADLGLGSQVPAVPVQKPQQVMLVLTLRAVLSALEIGKHQRYCSFRRQSTTCCHCWHCRLPRCSATGIDTSWSRL